MIYVVDKINGIDYVQDYQYNSVKNNVLDSVLTTGQTPDSDTGISDTNVKQLSTAIAIHAAGGNYYIDSGLADAYVLGVQTISGTPMVAPNVFFNGMSCRFIANVSNTGTSTVNVASLGIKTIRKNNGTDILAAGDIIADYLYTIIYNSATGFFELSKNISGDYRIVNGNLTVDKAITSTVGDITTTTGNFVIGTAGKGIDFSGVGTAANILHDYEEGAWTPIPSRTTGGAITATVTTTDCVYTKIGREVTLYCRMFISSVTAQGTGDSFMSGLPFENSYNQNMVGSLFIGSAITGTAPVLSTIASNKIYFSDDRVNLSNGDWKAGTIEFSISYITST